MTSIISAYATPKKTFPKARKGDVVGIRLIHSSTTVKFKKQTSESYFLAKASKVDRTGRVKEFVKITGTRGEIGDNVYVLVISDPERQAAACQLFSTTELDFKDLDSLKGAILDRIEATR